MHARVVAGLKPGGVYIFEAYTPAQLAFGTGGPKDPGLCMTLEVLRKGTRGGLNSSSPASGRGTWSRASGTRAAALLCRWPPGARGRLREPRAAFNPSVDNPGGLGGSTGVSATFPLAEEA